jgi:hypothetical protein
VNDQVSNSRLIDGLCGWVAAIEALPEIGVNVLATDGVDYWEVGFRSAVDERYDEWADFHFEVKYWMNIPETPTT